MLFPSSERNLTLSGEARLKPDPPVVGLGGPLMFNRVGSSHGAPEARSPGARASRTQPQKVSARPWSCAPLQTGAARLCSGSEPGAEQRAGQPGPHGAARTGAPSPAHGRCSPPQGTGAGGLDRAPARVSPPGRKPLLSPRWARAAARGRDGGCWCSGVRRALPRRGTSAARTGAGARLAVAAGTAAHPAPHVATACSRRCAKVRVPEGEAGADPQRGPVQLPSPLRPQFPRVPEGLERRSPSALRSPGDGLGADARGTAGGTGTAALRGRAVHRAARRCARLGGGGARWREQSAAGVAGRGSAAPQHRGSAGEGAAARRAPQTAPHTEAVALLSLCVLTWLGNSGPRRWAAGWGWGLERDGTVAVRAEWERRRLTGAGGNFFEPQNSYSSMAPFSAERKNKTKGEEAELFWKPAGGPWPNPLGRAAGAHGREAARQVAGTRRLSPTPQRTPRSAQGGPGDFPEGQCQHLAPGLWELPAQGRLVLSDYNLPRPWNWSRCPGLEPELGLNPGSIAHRGCGAPQPLGFHFLLFKGEVTVLP